MLHLLCTSALHFTSLPGVVLLTLNTLLIVGLSLLYRGNLRWRIYAALFVTALIFLSDTALAPMSLTNGYILNLFLSKILMFLLVLISVRLFRSFGDGFLSSWHWLFLFLCPLFSMLVTAKLANHLTFRSNTFLFPMLSSGLLLINFLIFLLYDRILYIQITLSKNSLLEQNNAYYVNQYLLTKERQQEIYKFQHDFKNILLGLRGKLQSGEGQTHFPAELDKLLGTIEKAHGSCSSGNVIIDSIINYKEQAAKKEHIPFYLDLNIPAQLELDTIEISVILGNALDNAIEACKVEGNTERHVRIQMHYLNQSLFIKIQNPYVHEIRTNFRGDIRSTKSGKHIRGLGLKNIQQRINDCNGLLEISYDDNLFTIEIVLFHIRRKDQEELKPEASGMI
ncbi:ATP-binding protein [Paenibacillus lentus]|uniref:ATP-binding protein n=1 Tax=Paenibacillus lentus TaxID=1338368 RepID=A0A3S8RVF4_9BACL|nr:ATP-binding protein [Paenibacillus lentus]